MAARRPRTRVTAKSVVMVGLVLLATVGLVEGGVAPHGPRLRVGGHFTQVPGPSIGSPTASRLAPSRTFPTPIQHVFLIMMENAGVDQVYGAPAAPYETSLADSYAWGGDAVTNASQVGYYAVCHPSAPNYLSITAGEPLQCGSDGYHGYSVDSLGNQLQAKGLSWVAYGESMSVPCQTYDSGAYAVRHMPFTYYTDLGGAVPGSVCSTHVLPIADLVSDYPYSATPPAFTYIAPNLIHDGHSSSVGTADAWLASFVPKLLAEPWFSSSVIFITYDESYGSNPDGGFAGLHGGPVYFVAVSPYSKGIGGYPADSSHYNALATVEWLLGIPYLGSAGPPLFPAMDGLFSFGRSDAVTFSESGLPLGTNWSVTLAGSTRSSTATTISFTGPNGTYPFEVGSPLGYTALPASGSLTVLGSVASQGITFSPATSSPPPNGFLGLAGTTGYYILAGLAGVVVVAIGATILLRRRKRS